MPRIFINAAHQNMVDRYRSRSRNNAYDRTQNDLDLEQTLMRPAFRMMRAAGGQ
jgi:hypothetical protein